MLRSIPDFVEKAMALKPAHMSMVIPAKWMMGDGKGTAKFLDMMRTFKQIASIVSTENCARLVPRYRSERRGYVLPLRR